MNFMELKISNMAGSDNDKTNKHHKQALGEALQAVLEFDE